MQNLITKTSFQILSMLLCPHISNYRTEPPRAFEIHINLPHLGSENTPKYSHTNVHKLQDVDVFSFLFCPCPKLGNKFAQKLASNREVRRCTN